MTETPVKGKAFTVPQKFLDDLPSLEDRSLESAIVGLCAKVEQLVAELGISDEYTGFVIDGDLSRTWRDCIADGGRGIIFVSRARAIPIVVLDVTHRARPDSCLINNRSRQEWG